MDSPCHLSLTRSGRQLTCGVLGRAESTSFSALSGRSGHHIRGKCARELDRVDGACILRRPSPGLWHMSLGRLLQFNHSLLTFLRIPQIS
jgi:hypothetical protein